MRPIPAAFSTPDTPRHFLRLEKATGALAQASNLAALALGTQLDHVEITALRDNIFHADLVFDDEMRISARPSDAVAIALHAERPIRATDELLDLVGITALEFDRTDADPDEAEIARFRLALEQIDPDDFTVD